MFRREYHYESNSAPINQTQYRQVKPTIPRSIACLLGVILLLLWIAITALEIISVYYDAGRGTVYAGLWSSPIFFVNWIFMFFYMCCGKSTACGIYLLIQNLISLIFAILVLIFTAIFVNDYCLCLGALCNIPGWDYIYNDDRYNPRRYSCTERTEKKEPILIALLACAAVMVVTNLIFIILYIIIKNRSRASIRSSVRQSRVAYQSQAENIRMGKQASYGGSYARYNQRRMYPTEYTETASYWPSAPPSYALDSNKF